MTTELSVRPDRWNTFVPLQYVGETGNLSQRLSAYSTGYRTAKNRHAEGKLDAPEILWGHDESDLDLTTSCRVGKRLFEKTIEHPFVIDDEYVPEEDDDYVATFRDVSIVVHAILLSDFDGRRPYIELGYELDRRYVESVVLRHYMHQDDPSEWGNINRAASTYKKWLAEQPELDDGPF